MRKQRSLAERATERGFTREIAQIHVTCTPQRIVRPVQPCTEMNYKRARCFWKQYNQYLGRDIEYGLHPSDKIEAMDIATYAEFVFKGATGLLNEYITYTTLKKYLHDLEAALWRSGNESITKTLMKDVMQEVGKRLLTTGIVPTNKREKTLVNPPDFLEIMGFLWAEDSDSWVSPMKRLRLSFFIYATAFAVTRPGGITLARGQSKTTSTLCYRDLELILIRIPNSEKCMFLLKAKLNNHKRRRDNDSLFNNVVLHDSDLARPVSQFIALAFADDVFEADEIKTPEDLLLVKPLSKFKRSSYTFRWKKESLDKPIFHTDGKPWKTQNSANALKYLGRRIGFKNNLTAYNIRYGIANSLETNTTLGARNQLLGHLDTERTFDQNYRSETSLVDVQSIFLGTPSITKLILQTTGHLRHRDRRAPNAPDPTQLAKVLDQDPLFKDTCKELEDAKRQLTTNLDIDPQEIINKIKTISRKKAIIKKQHWRDLVSSDRQAFFANIDTSDINQQISEARGKKRSTDVDPTFRICASLQLKPISRVRETIAERMNMKADLIGIDTVLIRKLLQYCKVHINGGTCSQANREVSSVPVPRNIQNLSEMSVKLKFQKHGADLSTRSLEYIINKAKTPYESVLGSYTAWDDVPNAQKDKILTTMSQGRGSMSIKKTKSNWILEWLFYVLKTRRQDNGTKRLKRKLSSTEGPISSKKQKYSGAPAVTRSEILKLPELPARPGRLKLQFRMPPHTVKKFLLDHQFDEQTANDYLDHSRLVYNDILDRRGKGNSWKQIDRELIAQATDALKSRVLQPAHFERATGDWLVEFLLRNAHYTTLQGAATARRKKWLDGSTK
ncbi:hypothetical protein TWF718_001532 [Orbilia javanica]|uniref:Uncharacterized protein n=1 Tax=Orbilia javanica TaxID=47235 RepID=A0AAN8RND5_9PEZI